jgi:uncharacterized protein (DUF1810 family)
MTREKATQLLSEANKYLQRDVIGKEWSEIEGKYVDKTYKFIDTAKFEFKIGDEEPSITLYAKLTDGNKNQVESLERIIKYFKSLE